jgi:hypothetical protein
LARIKKGRMRGRSEKMQEGDNRMERYEEEHIQQVLRKH